MTEHPTTPTSADEAAATARQARVAELARGRSTKRRHPAKGARIAAAGLGATTMLGLVGIMGYTAHPTAAAAPAPVAQPNVVVVVHRTGVPDAVATSTPATPVSTRLTARPTVRPAAPKSQAPAASTSGSH